MLPGGKLFSGRQWVNRYPESRSVGWALDFIRSIAAFGDRYDTRGGTTVPQVLTSNVPQRLYLMHYAYRIARESLDPRRVPSLDEVDIDWVHTDAKGRPDLTASKNAAEQMVQAFGLHQRPDLPSSVNRDARSQDKPVSNGTKDERASGSTNPSSSQGEAEYSGRAWVSRYPGSRSTETLQATFRDNLNRFLSALQAARATVTIANTLRPRELAYLMHYSYRIARESLDPLLVPSMAGVNIQWMHKDAQGRPDTAASKNAAEQMVQAFHVVYRPALKSRHTEGLAVDMNVTWQESLSIVDATGNQVLISTGPRNGAENTVLHQVGASYGVVKLFKDAPHWSSDGC
jgi:hypothetical protein